MREWVYSSTHSLTSALEGGEWWASRHGRYNPMVRAPGIHYIGGWVGPRAGVDAVMKRKVPSPRRESNPPNPDRPDCNQSLYRLSYPASQYVICTNHKILDNVFISIPHVIHLTSKRFPECLVFRHLYYTFSPRSKKLHPHPSQEHPTLWGKVHLQWLKVTQLVKKFLAFYGNRRFITVFIRAPLWKQILPETENYSHIAWSQILSSIYDHSHEFSFLISFIIAPSFVSLLLYIYLLSFLKLTS
jgi:hypothetical protein